MRIFFYVTLVIALIALAAPTNAQVTAMPNTGCEGSTGVLAWEGCPDAGGLIRFEVPDGLGLSFLIFGPPLDTPLLVPRALMCNLDVECYLGVFPHNVIARRSWALQIPNSPDIVGVEFAMQGGYLGAFWPEGYPCVAFVEALKVTVTPPPAIKNPFDESKVKNLIDDSKIKDVKS